MSLTLTSSDMEDPVLLASFGNARMPDFLYGSAARWGGHRHGQAWKTTEHQVTPHATWWCPRVNCQIGGKRWRPGTRNSPHLPLLSIKQWYRGDIG